LKDFSKEVHLRFATLDLVRSEWRKYNFSMQEGRESVSIPEPEDASFDVSAVNIEENGNRWPVNYVLPPGITRETDPYNPQVVQQNEQAIVLKAINLQDGDARALFKNVNLDLRNYKRLKMFVHAEAIDENALKDGEITAFIRVGTDYKDNYYEYEVPLVLTPYLAKGSKYSENKISSQKIVWPDSNQFDINLELFTKIKTNRNLEKNLIGSNVSMNTEYKMVDPEHTSNYIKVKGNPSLSSIRTIMIGIRNPSKNNRRNNKDDGLPKSVEVWMNELRLSKFDERGGWAATARLTTKLADLGTISASGAKSTPGFGSIEKKLDERQRETITQYDVSANIELGKFFPENIGVSLPLYMGYSVEMKDPEYNPLEPDIQMNNSVASDSIRKLAQQITERKSINITNVRVNNLVKNQGILNPANLSGSYAWNETYYKDFNTEFRSERTERWAFTYNYNARPKNITPFEKSKIFNKKIFRLIKDFNFYYMPSNIAIRTDIDRSFYSEKIRDINAGIRSSENVHEIAAFILPSIKPEKYWNRYYDFKYDITRNLKLDFSATTKSKIDPWRLSNNNYEDYFLNKSIEDFYNEWKTKNRIINNEYTNHFVEAGRNIDYNHSFNITYNLPINKLPMLDFTSSSVRYNTTYAWQAGPIDLINKLNGKNIDLGNTIKNSNTLQATAQLNFSTLYNKSKLLKDVDQRIRMRENQTNKPKKFKTVTYQQNLNFRANATKTVTHKLKTEDVTVKVTDASGKRYEADIKIIDENKVNIKLKQDLKDAIVIVDGKIEEKEKISSIILDYILNATMAVKNISGNYSFTNGSLFPGYKNNISILGLTKDSKQNLAPGLPYITGLFPANVSDTSYFKNKWLNEYQWFTKDTFMNNPFTFTKNERYDFRANVEPIPGFRIDLNANYYKTTNLSGNYKYYGDKAVLINNIENGNMSFSCISLLTAFNDIDTSGFSKTFKQMKDYYAPKISELQINRRTNAPKVLDSTQLYYQGYGLTSQDVLIPAFFAAYTGRKDKYILNFIDNFIIPLPNWTISYDGLGKIKFLKQYVRSISIKHAYRSSFNVASYMSNLKYKENELNMMGNYLVQKEISSVSFNEQFSPLISVDITTLNNILSRFEIKKDRMVSLSLSNNQINETQGKEIMLGTGYRIKDVSFKVNGAGGGVSYKSDIDIRFDFSWRDNYTVLRPILINNLTEREGITQNGTKIRTWKLTADYVLSSSLNIRFYLEQEYRKPYIGYKNVVTSGGFSVRFTLM